MRALVVSGGGSKIYTLSDPITGEIRYVGKTNNITKRMPLNRLMWTLLQYKIVYEGEPINVKGTYGKQT